MIRRNPPPVIFQSDQLKLAVTKMEEFYQSVSRGQKRYDFPFNESIDNELISSLSNDFGGCCGYCEDYLSYRGTVDRFRPHSGIRDRDEYFPDLYWWLTFKWDNLIYCCKECAEYKANYFPISGQRALRPSDDLELELPMLVDPCKDELNDHFSYQEDGTVIPLTDKGAQTIDLLRLNRASHKEKRRSAVQPIRNLCTRLSVDRFAVPRTDGVEYLQSIFNGSRGIDFVSFKRWVLLQELDKQPVLGEALGVIKGSYKLISGMLGPEALPADRLITNDFFPLEYIEIHNFKGISDLRIDFKENSPQKKSWLFLLGENGVGKSSILQAMAVGIKADRDALVPLLPRLVRNGKEEAVIRVKERNSDNLIETVLNRKKNSISQTGNFNSFLMGYGSLRLSVEESEGVGKNDMTRVSYVNLFSPIRPLNDITQWLVKMHRDNPDFFNSIAYSIKQLLPHDFSENELTVTDGFISFKESARLFSELSDGFKSTIILAVDIMMKLSDAHADMNKMTGIVLIDELGNQLHPRWQMRIVKQLRKVFPNMNFIVSTHHPLCLRGADQDEILLLKNIDGRTVPVTELPDPGSMRVDQLLASEFFGLSSLIDPELEAEFNAYYALLGKNDKLDDRERERLNELTERLKNRKQMGSSLREELMYHVIDTLLAKELQYNEKPPGRKELKTEVVRRVGEIWNRLNLSDNDQR